MNLQKGVRIIGIVSVIAVIIGLFQGNFLEFAIPIVISFIVSYLLDNVILKKLNKSSLAEIEKLLAFSEANYNVLSQRNMKAQSYYMFLNNPGDIANLKAILIAGDISLLFNPLFFKKILKLTFILSLCSMFLLIILAIKANSLYLWIALFSWFIPILLVFNQIRKKRRLFRLFILQMQYSKENKLHKVIRIAKKVCRFIKIEYGRYSVDYDKCLNNLGGIYKLCLDYKRAESSIREAFTNTSQLDNKMDAYFYYQCLFSLAEICQINSKYEEAELYYHQILDNCPVDDELFILISKKLSLIKLIQEDIHEVENLNRQIESRIRKVFGKQSKEYILFQSENDFLEMRKGNLRNALSYNNKQVEQELREKLHGDDLSMFLHNQGVNYEMGCNIEKAEKYFREAMQIRTEYWGEGHPATTLSKLELGKLLSNEGEFIEGIKLIREVLAININCYGEDHLKTARSCAELGHVLTMAGKYKEAEIQTNKALHIYEKLFSKKHPSYLNTLFNLGWLYEEMGDNVKAEKIIKYAHHETSKILGPDHPALKVDKLQLADFCIRHHQYQKALHYFKEVKKNDDKIIQETFSLGSDQHKLEIMDRIFKDMDKIFSFIVQFMNNNPEACSFAMDIVLQRKGLVLDVLISQKIFFKDKSENWKNKIKTLNILNRKISDLQLEGFETMPVSEYTSLLNNWTSEKKDIEEELSKESPPLLIAEKFDENIRYKTAALLKVEDVLVEYVKYDTFNFTENKIDKSEYIMLLMLPDQPDNIKLIRLGEALKIDELIKIILYNFRKGKESLELLNEIIIPLIRQLSDILLKPVIDLSGTSRNFYIVPDGELFKIPFEILLTSDNKYAIEKYSFLYLSSGRDIVSLKNKPKVTQSGKAVVIANPDFNLSANKDLQSVSKKEIRLGLGIADELSGTVNEAEQICKILLVEPIMGKKATKRMILSLMSPEYLHIATHGLFIERRKEKGYNDKNRLSAIDNPMLRSGLVFAGFNAWLKHENIPDEFDDGFLTAQDVVEMNLGNTELVVLSVCGSGLGDIDNGEGVFGLRRAFKLSGVKNMVMSMWNVSDYDTPILMTNFYHLIYVDKVPVHKALRKAQLKFMQETNRHPYLWGPFIFQGVAC